MTIIDLTKRAKYILRRLGIQRKVRVRELKKGYPWYWIVYGLQTTTRKGNYIIWMRRETASGREYTKRFQLSVLAHEIAHIWHTYHNKSFRNSQRYVSYLLRDYEKECKIVK